MLESIMSLPVSIALLVWILKMKKNDPFPKYTFLKLLIAGVISGILSSILSILGALITFIADYGLDTLISLFRSTSVAEVNQFIAQNTSDSLSFASILRGFLKTFILVGMMEEVFKFLCAKAVMKKEGVVKTWEDALFCLAIVAISFQLTEDMSYSSGNLITAIFRALTPFHFTFATVMGYYYGLAKTTGKKGYNFLALFIPSLLHTLFDYSITLTSHEDTFLLLLIAVGIFLIVLTVVMILKIRNWHKNKTLDVPISVS